MRGKAEAGDKTMVDALMPARECVPAGRGRGRPFPGALRRSATAAEDGMKASPIHGWLGRVGELTRRTQRRPPKDPGRDVFPTVLLKTAADAWSGG